MPQPLKNTKLYLMSVATLLAGAKFRGQFEERILGLDQLSSGKSAASCSSTTSTPS